MYDYLKPLIKKHPDNLILHIGTNNANSETSRTVLDEILQLKSFITKELPTCRVVISNLTFRNDNGKATLTIKNINEHLKTLNLDFIENGNIGSSELRTDGLHLNERGSGKLAMNFIRKIKSFSKK